MKVILITLLFMVTIGSCKKSSTETDKDPAASIKGKTCWGTFISPGKSEQYYSVHFSADSVLLWSQEGADYTGKWFVNGKRLTMSPAPSLLIIADISDDDMLMNFVSTNNIIINSGKLIANANIPLDYTIWKGPYPASPVPMMMQFLPGLKVDITYANAPLGVFPYKRVAAGGAIYTVAGGMAFFGVVASEKEIRGGNTPTNQWKITRQ